MAARGRRSWRGSRQARRPSATSPPAPATRPRPAHGPALGMGHVLDDDDRDHRRQLAQGFSSAGTFLGGHGGPIAYEWNCCEPEPKPRPMQGCRHAMLPLSAGMPQRIRLRFARTGYRAPTSQAGEGLAGHIRNGPPVGHPPWNPLPRRKRKGTLMALPEFSLVSFLKLASIRSPDPTLEPPHGRVHLWRRNGIHILDLTQTVPMLDAALQVRARHRRQGRARVLFVGTKRQAQRSYAEAAEKSAQFYMNHRWLGGTLTNWKTVSQSINRLKAIDETMAGGARPDQERAPAAGARADQTASLAGRHPRHGRPSLTCCSSSTVTRKDLAILEAKKLGIPVVAVVDTNCSPTASTTSSRAMTTRPAPSRCTATCSAVRPWTA